jgi:hypothetical protein
MSIAKKIFFQKLYTLTPEIFVYIDKFTNCHVI